jgi:hypothetical protein
MPRLLVAAGVSPEAPVEFDQENTMASRLLGACEIGLARNVFKDTLPYDKIYIVDYHLLFNDGVAVTLAEPVDKGTPMFKDFEVNYFIYWGSGVFAQGADSHLTLNGRKVRTTFIHELTHVWQGHNSFSPFTYMLQSAGAQGRAIREHGDRNRAYYYDPNNLRDWSSYNVEEQASIVEDWFSDSDKQRGDGFTVRGGRMSPTDPRFPYIERNIRARDHSAPYAPPNAATPARGIPAVRQYQEVLAALGYLKPEEVDGLRGPRFRTAIEMFQRMNRIGVNGKVIAVDGKVGPDTLALLQQPLHKLVKAPC